MIEENVMRSAPELAMREHLLSKLRGGQLEAHGVQFAPKQMRELEILPRHFFINAKMNWNGNKVTNFGVTYGVVQVRRRPSVTSQVATENALKVTADAPRKALAKPAGQETSDISVTTAHPHIEALTPLADQESANAQRRKPGPLSGKAAVITAYNQLLQTGVLTKEMTIKEIYKKLHSELKQNSRVFPNERGLSYPSIVRHLSPLLRSSSQVNLIT
jgi:hypothetical protein